MSTKEKIKSRLTALDINALVTELKQKLIGMRVSNIYNVDQKTYVFKFSKSEQKHFLIIENGVRFNLTDESGYEKSKMPSGFTMKFRKFLRSRRIEAIEQIGIERVVVFTFGFGEHAQHLILELYSQGNIILADKDFRIVQLTRQHQFSEQARVAPGEIYPFEYTATNYIEKFDVSEQHITDLLNKQNKQEQTEQKEEQKDSKGNKKGKKQQQQQQQAQQKMKDIIFKVLPCFHTSLVDDLIVQQEMNPNEKVTNESIPKIKQVVDFCYNYLINFCKKKQHKGFLVAPAKYLNESQNEQLEQTDTSEKKKIKYFDFVPDLASYHKGKYIEELPDFNSAVDKYFKEYDRTEEQPNIEDIAWKKFENIKNDQLGRIKKLQQEQDEYTFKARLIDENIQDVQAILEIIQKMVDGGLHWDKIAKMISESKKEGDPLANMIHDMDVKQNRITILLGDEDLSEELIPVDLDLRLSAYQNSRKYFENKKKHGQKEKKTKEAADQALKMAEKNALKEIEKEKAKQMKVQNARKKYWFEKFYWFISSDGFLVISGKDVQQNELVVKKYLDKNDLYMHADMYGSTSTVIKNPEGKTVPDNTLMQAATATICRSKAWESKIVVSAWWVYSHQVSKSAPTGLYVGAGSFMIYGKKNFIHPARLEMGYTLLFALDQESIARHAQERKQKLEFQSEQQTLRQEEADMEEQSEITEKNVFDTDEEEEGEQEADQKEDFDQQSEVKSVRLTAEQLKSVGQTGTDEVTIIEVNPNARRVQEKHQQKQQQKQPQQSQQQGGNKNKQQNQQKPKEQEQPQKGESNRAVRGKQKKNKKIKEKYAEQSDEEKELRMQLIGAKKTKDMQKVAETKQKEQDKQQKGNSHQDADDEKSSLSESQSKNTTEQKANINNNGNKVFLKPQSITANLLEKQNIQPKFIDSESQKEDDVEEKKEQPEDNVPDHPSSEDEADDAKEEEQVQEGVDVAEYQEMQKLVSYLYPDDQYVALVPMCAPYQVISNCKYKIKVQPGSLKKGRAAKDIMNFFMNIKEASVYEKKLMKMITDEDIVSNLMSGVKITGQGMLQMKQKEKQAKKESHKKSNK